MDEELEKLYQEKERIELEIKRLKDKKIECGIVKVDEVRVTSIPNRKIQWHLSVKTISDIRENEKYRAIIKVYDKSKLLGYIDKLINDLKAMKQEMEVQNDTKENKM